MPSKVSDVLLDELAAGQPFIVLILALRIVLTVCAVSHAQKRLRR